MHTRSANHASHATLRLLLAGALATALCAYALPTRANSVSIESITIKWRDDAIPRDATVTPDPLLKSLTEALQTHVVQTGRTRDGAFQLQLASALSLDEARAAINRVRMSLPVIYASVNAAPEAGRRVEARAGSPTTQQPPVTRLIVKYRDPVVSQVSRQNGVLDESQLAHLSTLAGQPVAHERAMSGGAFVVRLFQSVSFAEASALAATMESDPAIEYADPDGRLFPALAPNDTLYPLQWHYMSPPGEIGGVNLPPAWTTVTGSGSIYVAVIDTGILPHPDLVGRYQGGYDMISDPAIANDGDPPGCTVAGSSCGRDADPTDAGDWITSAESLSGYFAGCAASNSSWHGSHVSGTIGALTNNSNGVAGINWVSKILPVRVLGKCGGTFADITDAITWAYGGSVPGVPSNPTAARVMNISIGGASSCPSALQTAINNALVAGSVIAVAAGNSNIDAVNSTPGNCNGVITVAAIGRQGQRASYSNFGPLVEIAAPGGDFSSQGVLSTLNSGTTTVNSLGYNYVYYYGTSMATPHVAGIASLLLSANPALTPAQVLAKIQTSARAFPTGTGRDCTTSGTFTCGAGIIDAAAAIAAVTPSTPGWVYRPLEPCRIMDTRNATAGSGVQGPIAGGALKQLPGFITTGLNWSQYGQTGTLSDCGLTNPPGTSIKAVAIVITILNPNFDAFLGVSDANSLTTTLSTVALNYTHGQGLSTMYIVPQIAGNTIYFALPAGLSAQLIFDVVGYFVVSDATALACTTVTSGPVTIGAASTGSAISPACSAGYALSSGSCDSDSTSMKLTADKASGSNTTWTCSASNAGASAHLTATANCCRVPGK